MILIDCVQGSPEWVDIRLGLPTASGYDHILQPKKLEYSKGAEKYLNHLLAEWLCGYPLDTGTGSAWMERGTQMEPEARRWYEMHRGVKTQIVGFCMRDDEQTGCSPDALVGADGLVEIKCPALETHIGYMRNPKSLVDDYRLQVQGELYITGREWADVVSYHPDFPRVIQRVVPEMPVQVALHSALFQFCGDLQEAKEALAKYRMHANEEPDMEEPIEEGVEAFA